jgi:hypothetical protein
MPLTVETAPLGCPFTPYQLRKDCRAIYGAVCWPTRRAGFAVILAIPRPARAGESEMHLLAEAEADDLYELIHKCDALDTAYEPGIWLGDDKNAAAAQIMAELSAARQPAHPFDEYEVRRTFSSVCPMPLQEMESPYSYILPMLKGLLRTDYKRLFLKNSRVIGYLSQVKPDEIPYMKPGEYPAIEALGFVVREALNWRPQQGMGYDPAPPGAMTC